MHAPNYLRSDQRASCDNALKTDHVIEMLGGESSWVDTELAEASNEGAVIHLCWLAAAKHDNSKLY